MDKNETTYTFSAKIWYSDWHFVTLPQALSTEIRANFQPFEEGWGRLKATAKIGKSEWQTAIWFDTKSGAYLLPLKKEIRTREKVGIDSLVAVALRL